MHKSKRPNVLIKIPGTPEGVPAIEESTFEGVPVNVTLLFSREQYIAAAEAYMRGIESRIAAGRDPKIHSVASVFIGRWDKAVMGKVPEPLQNRLGIAIAGRTMPNRCWPSSRVQESMFHRSRANCSVTGPKPLISHGTI
jgi:transaldolase